MTCGHHHRKRIEEIIRSSELLRLGLGTASQLNLPSWWIVGGAIRDEVWKSITGQLPASPVADLDLVYFDKQSTSKATDNALEGRLPKHLNVPWSIKNQARMHGANRPPYSCAEEGIHCAPETISSIAIKLTPSGDLMIVSFYNLEDLFDCVLRPTPAYLSRATLDEYKQRVSQKSWLTKWPMARIEPW